MQKFTISFFLFFVILTGEIRVCAQQSRPTDISGLALWYRSDSNVVLNGSAVTNWNDCSGNNNNAIQSIASKQPQFINNIPLLNNYPAIRFDGVDDFMSFTEISNIRTCFFVIKHATGTSTSYPPILGHSSLYNFMGNPGDHIFSTTFTSQNILNGQSLINGNSVSASNLLKPTNYSIIELITTGNVAAEYITCDRNTYGWWEGDYIEIILYNEAVSESNRVQIENYIRNKYAPPVSLGNDIAIPYGFCDTLLSAGSRFKNYLWSTSDTIPEIHVNSSGLYWVRTTDIFGFQSSDTIEISYTSRPNPISDTIICQFDTAKVNLNIGSPYSYNWSNGQSTANFSTTSPGLYQLQIADSLGCIYRDTFTVILDSLPSKLTLGNDTAICFSNLLGHHLIDYTPIDGLSGNFRYLWNTGDTTATTTVNNTGDYSLRLSNQRGCVARDTVNITMQGIPPSINYTISKNSSCTGDTIHFADLTSGEIVSRTWDLGNGTSFSDSTFDYSYNNAGTYIVSLTVTGNNLCPKSETKTLLIYAAPQVSFTTVPACTGLPTYFTNSSTAAIGDTILNQLWNFDDLVSGTNNTSTLQNPEHLFSNAGTFSPKLSITTSKGCSVTAIQTLDVASTATSPEPSTLVSPQNNALISDSTVTFKWNESENGYFYTLQIATDAEFSNIQFQKPGLTTNQYNYHFTTFGLYYWRVITMNFCGNEQPSNIQYLELFSPHQIQGLQAWFNPDYGITQINGKITRWDDISGLNRTAIQNDTNKAPLLLSNRYNNHSIIQFDGSNDGLTIQDSLTLNSVVIMSAWSGPETTFNNYRTLICCTTPSTLPEIFLIGNDGTTNIFNGFFGNNLYMNNIKTNNYAPFNKYKITTGTNSITTTYANTKTLRIGNDLTFQPWKGYIPEILLYNNTSLDSTILSKLSNYLQTKYAPPVCLGYDIKVHYKLCDTLISAQANHFTNYLWSTGDTTPSIHVNHNGSYWVLATNIFGIQSSDTIEVYFQGKRSLPDTTFCLGNSYQYTWQPLTNYTLNWSNGNIGSTFTETQAGSYSFILTDTLGCTYRDTFNLYVDSLSLRMSLGNDLSLCSGNILQSTLDNYTITGPQYLWSTGDTTPTITLNTTGNYWLQLTNNHGCVARDTVSVYIHGMVPFVSFTAPGRCLGETTPFSDLSHPQDPYSVINQWHWDFGDGNNASTQNTTHNYANPGIYPITLTVTTDSNCSNSLTLPTVVYTLPEVYFTPILGCSNTPIQFTDRTQYTDNYTINQWQWDFGDLQSGSNNHSALQHPEHPFDTAGTYTIKLRATSIVGCSDSLTQIVTIRSAPTAYFSASNTCDGETTWFNDSTATELWNPVTYREWQFDDGNTSNLAVTSKKYDAPGSYPVTYIINTLNGCTDTVQKMVNVYSIPVANFNANAFCLNEPIELESSSTVDNDLIAGTQWTTGNQLLGITSPITLHIDSAGSYPVRLFVISAHQCKDSITKTMVVKPIPQAQFSYNYDEHTIGYQIQFANTTTGGFTYEWYNQSTLFSTQAQPQYDFGAEGNYPILMIATNSEGCSDSASATILVSSPVMDIAITDLAITPIGDYRQATAYLMNMSNRNITDLWLNLNLNQQAAREHWTGMLQPGNIVPFTFQTQMRIPTNEALMYGCATVESPLFSLETNLDNNRTCVSLTEDFTIISVYPNPAHKEANILISIPFSSTITLKILSSSGELVKEITYSDYQRGISAIPIPLENIRSGLYILELSFNGKTERRKLAVE